MEDVADVKCLAVAGLWSFWLRIQFASPFKWTRLSLFCFCEVLCSNAVVFGSLAAVGDFGECIMEWTSIRGMLGFGWTMLLIVCLFRVRLEVYFLLCA